MTVVIHWDWTLAITITVFGLLGGFVSHHIRRELVKSVKSESSKSRVSMKIVVATLSGSVSGLALSLLLPLIVDNIDL